MDYEKQMKTQKKGLAATIFMMICMVVIIVMFLSDVIGGSDYNITNSLDFDNVYAISNGADDSTIIQFDEMMVIDAYASYGNVFNKDTDKDDFAYFTVMIYDNEDYPYFASLEVEVGTDMYNQLMAYSNDETQTLGDMVIPACVTIGHEATDINGYYKDAVDQFNEWLGEEGYYIPDSYLKMRYAFETPDQLGEYAKAQGREYIYVGAVLAVFLIAAIFGLIKIIKNMNRLKNTSAEEFNASVNVQTPSYAQPQYTNTQTGEYYDPNQSYYFNPVQNQDKDNNDNV